MHKRAVKIVPLLQGQHLVECRLVAGQHGDVLHQSGRAGEAGGPGRRAGPAQGSEGKSRAALRRMQHPVPPTRPTTPAPPPHPPPSLYCLLTLTLLLRNSGSRSSPRGPLFPPPIRRQSPPPGALSARRPLLTCSRRPAAPTGEAWGLL